MTTAYIVGGAVLRAHLREVEQPHGQEPDTRLVEEMVSDSVAQRSDNAHSICLPSLEKESLDAKVRKKNRGRGVVQGRDDRAEGRDDQAGGGDGIKRWRWQRRDGTRRV